MNTNAQILFAGTTLQLPTQTAYEREVLFDYVSDAARRHGRVRLRAGGHDCTLRPTRHPSRNTCTDCGRGIRVLICELAGRIVCRQCLWRRVTSARSAAEARFSPADPPTAAHPD